MKIKKGAKLSKAQKLRLEKHAQHHTPKHIKSMKMHMLQGKSFAAAHKAAKK
eukprot:SAG31_NODE_29538_length_393_cov_1.469388_2_plen_52_part_00